MPPVRVVWWALALLVVWVLVVGLHTLFVVAQRRTDKRRMCLPSTVYLPSVYASSRLDDHAVRLSHILRSIQHRAGIPIWAVAGTALGIERHAGRIPWDDDIDMAICESDVPRLVAFLASPEGADLQCSLDHTVRPLASCVRLVHKGEDLADLFAVRVDPDDPRVTELAWSSLQKRAFDVLVRMPAEQLDFVARPLVWRAFDNTTLPTLADNDTLVATSFGSGAMQEVVMNAPHNPLLFVLFHLNPFMVRRFPIDHDCMTLKSVRSSLYFSSKP
jgi:hypothetical protein